jgi:hypothetical protein
MGDADQVSTSSQSLLITSPFLLPHPLAPLPNAGIEGHATTPRCAAPTSRTFDEDYLPLRRALKTIHRPMSEVDGSGDEFIVREATYFITPF